MGGELTVSEAELGEAICSNNEDHMRIQRYVVLLTIAILGYFILYWYWRPGVAPPTCDEGCPVKEVRADEARSLDKELIAEVKRYRAEKDWRGIAKDVALSQTGLWEKCSRGIFNVELEDRQALAHFASAYFKRGMKQREELIALLKSNDEKQVAEVLYLLGACGELGPDWGWAGPLGGLGGADIAHHIAKVYKTHPHLGALVASDLRLYDSAASGEITVLLWIALSDDDAAVYEAVTALRDLDRDGVFTKFGLHAAEPLTVGQREAIKKYLASLEQAP